LPLGKALAAMGFFSGNRFRLVLLLLAAGWLAFYLSGGKRVSERDFVGKWQSSRLVTPLHLAANGEWEIKTDAGAVLQYGVWRYEDKKIVWTIKQGARVSDDANPVLAVAPAEFRLKERDGSTTVFKRLE
jgi:hypothetical protein